MGKIRTDTSLPSEAPNSVGFSVEISTEGGLLIDWTIPGPQTSQYTEFSLFCITWQPVVLSAHSDLLFLGLPTSEFSSPKIIYHVVEQKRRLHPISHLGFFLPNALVGITDYSSIWELFASALFFSFLSGGSDDKECLQCRRPGFDPWVGKIPWGREWPCTPVFLLGEFHGQRNLAGYSPWGRKDSDMTEWLTLPLFMHIELDVCENKAIKFSRLIFRLKETIFFLKFSQSTFIWKNKVH